ncbi:MAG: hypothetical protein RIS34_120 [Pseudomonadota bacterium]|jgi:LacI family transcriptional regulator
MTGPTTITIAEIARLAGVGTATVDRVINGRPGVNAETIEKVRQVIDGLQESSFGRGRPRGNDGLRFVYVLPDGDSPFLAQVERHIAHMAGDFRHQHITAILHRFSADDPGKFAADLAQVGDCDGVAVMAVDVPAIKRSIADLVRAGIHVITLFSDVAGSARQLFVGADNRAAGRTAGLLIGNMAGMPNQDTVLLLSQTTRLSAEIERRIGFAQVIEERFPRLQLVRMTDLPMDDEGVLRALVDFFQEEMDPVRLAGAYVVGLGVAGLVRSLAQMALAGKQRIVAHDHTDVHASLLATGDIDFLLYQDIHYCISTAANALRKLCENARGALNIVQPRVEILTVENLH